MVQARGRGYAGGMVAEGARPPVTRVRDGREWRIGSGAEVAWINDGTSIGVAITRAIPPIFAGYGTLVLPQNGEGELTRHERAVIALLSERTEQQPWWLGYLDTGASDIVFRGAPMVTLYPGWRYVLVEAGPQQAASWRHTRWMWALPELMFPADRSWLVSTLWLERAPAMSAKNKWDAHGVRRIVGRYAGSKGCVRHRWVQFGSELLPLARFACVAESCTRAHLR